MFVAQIAIFLQYIFLIGVVLAIVGHVGRRVFADNSCWQCGFDLSGHPSFPDGPFPMLCSECGESIADAEMLKVDTRAPRAGVRRVGLILMLAIVPVVVIFVRGGYSLDRYRVATNHGIIGLIGAGDNRASNEFERRFEADRFTDVQRREIGRRIEGMILAIPQDRIEPGTMQSLGSTTAMWGDVYLDLIDSGDVTKEEAQTLFGGITEFSLKFPLHNKVADQFFCRVEFHGHSVGTENIIVRGIDVQLISLRVGEFDLSVMSAIRSDSHLASDWEVVNTATTLATSWTFSVPSSSFVLTESMVGTNRVKASFVMESFLDDFQGFTSDLMERAYGGVREYELEGDLLVQPYNDKEMTRGLPDLADIIAEHGSFELFYNARSKYYELSLTIDDQFELQEDTVIIAQIDEDGIAGEVIGWSKMTFVRDKQRVMALIRDDHSEIEKQGGVWVKLDAVDLLPRDQAWRPLVITGDVDPIWVPLDK